MTVVVVGSQSDRGQGLHRCRSYQLRPRIERERVEKGNRTSGGGGEGCVRRSEQPPGTDWVRKSAEVEKPLSCLDAFWDFGPSQARTGAARYAAQI